MKFKGKIVQIMKEEDAKKYGLAKMANVDWLNIRPVPKINTRAHLYFFGLLVIGFILSYLLNYINQYLSVVPVILSLVIGIYLIWKEGKHNEETLALNGTPYWYFDSPIPVEKPHNFKINDEINIELNLNPTNIEDIREAKIMMLESEIIKLKEEILQLMSRRNNE
jgi:hypothetical protein